MFNCKRKHQEPKSNEELYDDIRKIESVMFEKYSGIKEPNGIVAFDVPIILNGKEEFIHTTRCGDDNKEDLVLIHGYLAGQMSFYRMLKKLSAHYRLWCIDLIGMGVSSRPEFTCTTTEETIDYFLDSIEQWRKAVGLERFHLSGQSFGGYMSTMYAHKFPEHVKKLILLTPAGISRADPDFVRSDRILELPWWKRQVTKQVSKFWENKLTPHVLYEKVGILKSPILKIYVTRARLFREEGRLGFNFLDSILKLPESTLKALHLVLAFPNASAYIPLEDIFCELKMPCEIYFGQRDWITKDGAYRAKERGDFIGDIHIIPRAGHLMNFENPDYVSDLMIKHKHIENTESIAEVLKNEPEKLAEIQTIKAIYV